MGVGDGDAELVVRARFCKADEFEPPVGQQGRGAAPTFEAARAEFETAWSKLLPTIPEAAFDESRHDRYRRAEMAARRARGEKLNSEIPSSLMRRACGTTFDGWEPAENQLHAPHIYAAQADDGIRR